MTNELAWFKLLHVKSLGAKSLLILYKNLSKNSLNVSDIFEMNENHFYNVFNEFGKGIFSRVRYENFKDLDEDKIFESFKKLKENNITIIPLNDELYPKSLKKRLKSDSPPILFCKGYLPLLNSLNISIVGSRDIDDFSLLLTKELSKSLSNLGYNIVSGYAKGVDTNAHLGALEADGTTTVVLSLGINNLSVKSDFKLFDWENNTLFISQFLPFERWSARNAMTRNKVVCGLSDAVIVIASGPEKDTKGRMSGTFDAGKSALKMNIPVFVLSPSVIENPQKGNEQLIRAGAIEFSTGAELVEYLKKPNELKKNNICTQLSIFGH
jgi:DNA processing protein